MLKVHVAPKGVDAHELNRPRALGDGAVATDSIHSNGFFFVYSLLACDLSRSWRGYVQSVSCPLSARWRLVASTPFALRPGLSHGDVKRTGRITSAAA